MGLMSRCPPDRQDAGYRGAGPCRTLAAIRGFPGLPGEIVVLALWPAIAGGSPRLKPDVPPKMVVQLEQLSAYVAFGVMASAPVPQTSEQGVKSVSHRSGRLCVGRRGGVRMREEVTV